MELYEQRAPQGATKKRKRVGRGESSGWGKTAGRGGKGQTARTGKGKPALGFEGGQVPMYRRMPKRGFVNARRRSTLVWSLARLAAAFSAGDVVRLDVLQARGLCSKKVELFRIVATGSMPFALQVHAHHFSAGARALIEAAGGAATDVSPRAGAATAA